MKEPTGKVPHPPARQTRGPKATARAEREQRLAAALRENLRRRKEQARAQEEAPPRQDLTEEKQR